MMTSIPKLKIPKASNVIFLLVFGWIMIWLMLGLTGIYTLLSQHHQSIMADQIINSHIHRNQFGHRK